MFDTGPIGSSYLMFVLFSTIATTQKRDYRSGSSRQLTPPTSLTWLMWIGYIETPYGRTLQRFTLELWVVSLTSQPTRGSAESHVELNLKGPQQFCRIAEPPNQTHKRFQPKATSVGQTLWAFGSLAMGLNRSAKPVGSLARGHLSW